MDCDELIDEMLSCSGGTAEKQHYEGTAGDSLDSLDACSGGGHEVAGQSRQQPAAPDSVLKRKAGVQAGLLANGKTLTQAISRSLMILK